MDLKTYFKTSGISRGEFCEGLDIHYQYLSKLVLGKRTPSPDLALKIEEATGGAVTRMELLYPTTPKEKEQ